MHLPCFRQRPEQGKVPRMALDSRRVAIVFAGAASFINLYTPQAILPFMAQEFAASAADASLILTAGSLAVALTAPFSGAVADVLGRKWVIAGAMLLLIVPTVMCAFAPSLEALIFWRFVQGLLLPPIFAVTVAYVGDEWPPQEATGVIGLYAAASGFGGFLGRFLPGILADHIGWRGGFLMMAAITLGCFLVVLTCLPREKKFVRASDLAASLKQMLNHLRNPKLLAIYAVGFGVLFNFMAVFTYVNFHLAAPPFNASAAFLGSIFVVYLGGSLLTPWIGFAVARLGRRNFVLGVLVLWIAGLAVMLVPSIPLIVLGLLICAVCGFLTQASSTSYVAVSAQSGTSAAVGLYVMLYYIGGSLGAYIPGLTWEAAGWPAVLAMVSAMICIIGVIVARWWEG
jgi:predicted MFS family arabinose efflux permease